MNLNRFSLLRRHFEVPGGGSGPCFSLPLNPELSPPKFATDLALAYAANDGDHTGTRGEKGPWEAERTNSLES